jgi:hypothetical protein
MRKPFPSPLVPAALALLLGACGSNPSTESAADTMVVHQGALCGCCGRWMDHLQQNGLAVRGESYARGLAEFKDQWGVPQGLRGCHTGVWNGKYVFEGHVPARYIRQYLSNPPAGSIGLAAPGMPAGSPGMELRGEFKPYNLYLLQEGGDYRYFATVSEPG